MANVFQVTNNEAWSKHVRVYIATGVICGILLILIAVIIFVLVRVKSKSRRRPSNVVHQYDTEAREAYKAYEPSKTEQRTLTSWLDSLPRSNDIIKAHSPNTTASADLSLNGFESASGTLKRGSSSNTHTLTKTNPYRHKVLTNGSFLNLNIGQNSGMPEGALPSGSSSGSGPSGNGLPGGTTGSDDASNSSRPTTSTEDNNSDSGNETTAPGLGLSPRVNPGVHLKRSNTNAGGGPPPDLLPPPDGFNQGQKPSGLPSGLPEGSYPINTDDARAIIDTYSGHLFSRSTNYYSFRDSNPVPPGPGVVVSHPRVENPRAKSTVEALFTRDPANIERDSLEVPQHFHHPHNQQMTSSSSNYYDKGTTPKNAAGGNNSNSTIGRKTRTESVV